jgi:hypothetical protein
MLPECVAHRLGVVMKSTASKLWPLSWRDLFSGGLVLVLLTGWCTERYRWSVQSAAYVRRVAYFRELIARYPVVLCVDDISEPAVLDSLTIPPEETDFLKFGYEAPLPKIHASNSNVVETGPK